MINKIIKSFLNGYIAIFFLSIIVVVLKPVKIPPGNVFTLLFFSQLLMLDLIFWFVVFVLGFLVAKVCVTWKINIIFYIVMNMIFNFVAIEMLRNVYVNVSERLFFTIFPNIFSPFGLVCTMAALMILTSCVCLPLIPRKD